MHADPAAGWAVGQVGHAVQVQTGVAPPPQSQTTELEYIHGASPPVHALWLSGTLAGQVAAAAAPSPA